MPSFSKLRSITPRGSRRRPMGVADHDPMPSAAHYESSEDYLDSVASEQMSSTSSVDLYSKPGNDGRKWALGANERPHEVRSSNSTAGASSQNSLASPSTHVATNEIPETDATSVSNLPALQTKGPPNEFSHLAPVLEDDPASYLLIDHAHVSQTHVSYSLEERGEKMFSSQHLQAMFDEPAQLLKFTSFLSKHRPQSVPLLLYYLDALKALTAIKYSNAVAEAMVPLDRLEFSQERPNETRNTDLEKKAHEAFELLARDDLPAFVTYTWVRVVSSSINKRVTGTMPPHLREMSEGLAEVFCLTDPSLKDNPIVFASEEFYRTTQYGVSYAIGRNCRFLQGPQTNRDSIRRLKEACEMGRDHCETFVNYRRDGSPFMNLLMMAPLRDNRGTLRYFIGAQVDVSGLAKECTELDALQKMLADQSEGANGHDQEANELEHLSKMFNQSELEVVRRAGGRMHKEYVEDTDDTSSAHWHRPRLLLKNPSDEVKRNNQSAQNASDGPARVHGKLLGVYTHYLLVRPYPSLRILFASPSLRVPGMLQSPFIDRIGSSERVREELLSALAEGRGVTAKIRWVSKHEDEGRNRWIHCTPLLGSDGSVGVWMVVLVDDENSRLVRRFKEAPPVAPTIPTKNTASRAKHYSSDSGGTVNGGRTGNPDRASSALSDYVRTSSLRGERDESFSI